VSGAHAYIRPTASPLSLVVTVRDAGGQTASHTTAVSVNSASLSAPTGFAVNAAQGQMLSNVTLGTFTIGNPFAYPGDFSATIDWGDGTTSDQGIVTLVGGSLFNLRFAVSGSHTYTDPSGSPYPVAVTVTKLFGSTTTINTTATVTQTPLAVTAASI